MADRRDIRVEGERAFVPLTRGLEAVIDVDDVPLIDGLTWFAAPRGRKIYAAHSQWRDGRSYMILMHRIILRPPARIGVDHRDGNGLHNFRENLRVATKSQNAMNAGAHVDSTSGIKGVHWSKRDGKWKTEICAYGKRKHLGLFTNKEDAAAAYREAALRLHGEFARVP